MKNCETHSVARGKGRAGASPAHGQEESAAFRSVVDALGGAIFVFSLWEAAQSLFFYVAR
ncbi:MAG TPA: hypothetical protein VL244_07620 [Alphaproteobacteria bacterium]|nr:hypothetical protein [Alphaproteobacteria bacterium]